MKKFKLFIVIIVIGNICFAQTDTTTTAWFKSLPDTAQLRILVEISDSCDINDMLDYSNRALVVGKRIVATKPHSDYISYYAAAYSNKAYYYDQVGKIKESLESNLKALSIREETKDSIGMAESYNNLAFIFQQQGDYTSAISYYNKAEAIYLNRNDKKGLATIYINLGYDYYLEKKMDSSQLFFEKALEIAEEIGDVKASSYALNNLASIYHKRQLYDKSEQAYLKSLKQREQLGIKDGVARSYQNLGRFYYSLNKFDKALYHAKISNRMAYELNSPDLISSSSFLLSDLYYQKKMYQKSRDFLTTYIEMRDSILSDETRKTSIKQKMKYEFEKQKVLDDAAYEKQLAISAEQEKKQKVIIYFIAGGLALVILFSIIIFNRLQVTRKQKLVIEEQKREVENQKILVDEKNKEITDSITYAKRIQEAILPTTKLVKEWLPSSFIFYKPKDIVAGDFYWLDQQKDIILFAAADCTGHGVPGAMVSVVCHNAMNRAVKEFNLTDPGKILDKTREIVVEQFNKSEDSGVVSMTNIRDGMDIALCILNTKTNALQYAGAYNPLWVLRKDDEEIEDIKANKQSIGKVDNPQPFTTHQVQLNKGDSLYIFSDGYVDQFGGEKGKKFKSKAFKRLLVSNRDKKIENQLEALNNHFETWKGDLEQVDDVCVIGVKI